MTAAPVPASAGFDLADARFVELTTFRRTGAAVPTPVWVAGDGDALVVLTPTDSGKVARIRHTPRVALRACGRTGAVADDVRPVDGVARIVTDPTEARRLTDLVRRRYGLEYRVVMAVERLAARRRKPRVVLRITTG